MRKTAVVVEDTAAVRALLVNFLARHDCRVLEAEDGREGLAVVQAEQPSLVVLDVNMPRMSGREMLERLRNDPETCHVPVIMATAQTAKEVIVPIVALGVNAYLVKPISRTRFDHEVAKVLGTPSRTRGAVSDDDEPVAQLGWHDDVPMIVVARVGVADLPRLGTSVRALLDRVADDGYERVLLDLRAVQHFASGLAHVVADAIRLTKRRRMELGAVASAAITAGLQSLEETCMPCGTGATESLEAMSRRSHRCLATAAPAVLH